MKGLTVTRAVRLDSLVFLLALCPDCGLQRGSVGFQSEAGGVPALVPLQGGLTAFRWQAEGLVDLDVVFVDERHADPVFERDQPASVLHGHLLRLAGTLGYQVFEDQTALRVRLYEQEQLVYDRTHWEGDNLPNKTDLLLNALLEAQMLHRWLHLSPQGLKGTVHAPPFH